MEVALVYEIPGRDLFKTSVAGQVRRGRSLCNADDIRGNSTVSLTQKRAGLLIRPSSLEIAQGLEEPATDGLEAPLGALR
jgi:hypothetical protein